MGETAPLELHVLGAVTATRDGVVLPLGGKRQRAVLAALVVARGQAVHLDRLADWVWAETPPTNVVAAVQSSISLLRRHLEPAAAARRRGTVIASAGGGYALRVADDAVDAWRFEQAVSRAAEFGPVAAAEELRAALDLWTGPAFAEYDDQPWAAPEIVRLHELRDLARERLLAARLELDDPALLIGDLEALVAESPLREERWRLLALGLYRAQRQADALAALRRARETLADTLGVAPGPGLRAIEQQVLLQAPTLDVTGSLPEPPAPPADRTSLRATTVPPSQHPPRPAAAGADVRLLVERDEEVDTINGLLDGLDHGSGGLVVLEGPMGRGKTRILAHASGEARSRGVAVAAARSSAVEQPFGFGVVRQLFQPVVDDPSQPDTVGVDGTELARDVLQHVCDDSDVDGFAVLHSLYRLTVALAADRPLLILVDDLHWTDVASMRFLAYLAKRIADHPVAILVALRPGEADVGNGLVDALVVDCRRHLRLAPLSHDATRTLVEDRLGPAAGAFVDVCHRTTDGNPLLLEQVLGALACESIPPDVSHCDTVRALGSRAISDVVSLRLRRMPADAVAVARSVAVLGADADIGTLVRIADLSDARMLDALDLLVRSDLLRDDPPRFVHPVVGDAVYAMMSAAERSIHHERAIAVLRPLGIPPDRLGAHALEAPRRGDGATVALLRAAARDALGRGAGDLGRRLLQRALEEPALGLEREDVLAELAAAESHESTTRPSRAFVDILDEPDHGAPSADPIPSA